MSMGLWFMYTKFDIPWYLKVLFPFTYFAFYQSTIVVRSYSMILLGISMVFYFFEKRYKKTWKFCLAMIYFMGISMHTFLTAGGFFAITLLFLKNDYKKLEDKTKKQMIATSVILFMLFLLLLIIIFPNANMGFGGNGGKSIFYAIGESTFANGSVVVQIISTIVLIGLILYIIIKNFKSHEDNKEALKELEKIFAVVPLLILYIFLHSHQRYFALLYFMIVLFFINNKKYPIVKTMLVCMFAVQIVWNIKSCVFDYHEKYAVGEEISEFLKEINYKEKTIDTVNYHVVEISPYFKDNVFYHSYNTQKSFYSWNINSGFLKVEDLVEQNADIYIIPLLLTDYINDEYRVTFKGKLYTFLKEIDFSKYNVYSFDAFVSQKGIEDEHDTFLIFVNEDVQKGMDEKGITLKEENRKIWIYDFDEEIFKMFDFSAV